MTGRDNKTLIKLHRESKNLIDNTENHKIFSKLADNPMLTKYEPVNYGLFKDFIKGVNFNFNFIKKKRHYLHH